MTPNDLATHQEKVYDIDDHMGMVFSGLTADARFLCKFMRNDVTREFDRALFQSWFKHNAATGSTWAK